MCYLNGQNGVRSARVLVKQMGCRGPVQLALLQNGQDLVHGLNVRGEQIVDEEALLLAAPDLELARRRRVDQVADLLVVDLEVGDAYVEDRGRLLGAQTQLIEEIVDGARYQAVVVELLLTRQVVLATCQNRGSQNRGCKYMSE